MVPGALGCTQLMKWPLPLQIQLCNAQLQLVCVHWGSLTVEYSEFPKEAHTTLTLPGWIVIYTEKYLGLFGQLSKYNERLKVSLFICLLPTWNSQLHYIFLFNRLHMQNSTFVQVHLMMIFCCIGIARLSTLAARFSRSLDFRCESTCIRFPVSFSPPNGP